MTDDLQKAADTRTLLRDRAGKPLPNVTNEVALFLGDGEHLFKLGFNDWCELEEKLNGGAMQIYRRIANGLAGVRDIAEVIRVALIGGGLSPEQAAGLVDRYVKARPMAESLPVAEVVCAASIIGIPVEGEDGS